MSDVAGDVFAYGIAAGISPVAFLATIAILTTKDGSANAVAFLAGFAITISGVCVAAALVASALASPELAEMLAILVKLALGLFLLAAAWRVRPRDDDRAEGGGKMQAMLGRFDGLTLTGSFGAGALLIILPRRLMTTVLAGLTIGIAATSPAPGLGLTVLYALTASVLIWSTIVISVVAGERGNEALRSAREWFVAHAGIIVFGVSLLLGALFTGQALIDLLT